MSWQASRMGEATVRAGALTHGGGGPAARLRPDGADGETAQEAIDGRRELEQLALPENDGTGLVRLSRGRGQRWLRDDVAPHYRFGLECNTNALAVLWNK